MEIHSDYWNNTLECFETFKEYGCLFQMLNIYNLLKHKLSLDKKKYNHKRNIYIFYVVIKIYIYFYNICFIYITTI